MSGVIEDAQLVVLEPVDVTSLQVGDAVFVARKRASFTEADAASSSRPAGSRRWTLG